MKMVLTLTLIWILSSTTEALRCLQRNNYTTTEETCSSPDQLCATTARRDVNAGPDQGVNEGVSRGCQPPSFCTMMTFSYKVGSAISALSTRCCNTDLCNDDDFPYPDVTTKNGLQCISCVEPIDPECKLIECVGEQDRCFQLFAEDNHARGCASAGFCEFLNQSSQMSNSDFTRAPICNSAGRSN